MKNLILLLLGCLIFFTSSMQWYQEGSPTFLDRQNMDKSIKEPKMLKFVKFMTPWCGYCRKLKKIVDEYKKNNQIDRSLQFYDVNCQGKMYSLCSDRFGVRSFPTIIIYDQFGKVMEKVRGYYPKKVVWELIGDINTKARVMTEQNIQGSDISSTTGVNPEEQSQQTRKKREQNAGDASNLQSEQKDSSEILNDQQNKDSAQQKTEQQKEQNKNSTIIKLVIYTLCFVLGGFYFLKLMVPKDQQGLQIETETSYKEQYKLEPSVSQIIKDSKRSEQKEEIENLVDDEWDEDS